MNSRLLQILLVVGALVAFLPVLAADFLLDVFIKERESRQLSSVIGSLTNETQQAVHDGVEALGLVLNASPSLCTPTFVANVQKQLLAKPYLKQILVENNDGVQYCDGFGGAFGYSMLSRALTIPGNTDAISVVRLAGQKVPSLRITRFVGANRTISAFVDISPRLGNGMPAELDKAVMLRMSLTDGTPIIVAGNADEAESHIGDESYVFTSFVADALPIVTEVVIPFPVLRAGYAGLDIAVTMLVVLMSGALLILAFQYVRQAKIPSIDLQLAIERGEIKPYYQPVMNISTGRLAGCEALVRWEKKDGKLVPPGDFIEYAEVSGLAIPMTIKLMQQIKTDLGDLCAELPDLKIGINLFDGHFRDSAIVEDVQTIFGGSSIGFRQLVFEITERRPLENKLALTSVIGGLHALGCRVAIDDVGTGHSNLEYMQTLGVDIIKIDRVFVDMIQPGVDSVPILDGLIKMATEIGTGIVAEGVETEVQALYLRGHGVVEAQGFLFAPALRREAFTELARALNSKAADGAETGEPTPEEEPSSEEAAA